ncbi:DUF2325 domain-containing protein [Burkholderia perseverans]|uniref:DUF2325 domain-containing protein n=1 Tax=Burkholderia perseverans TaxID=2615214 RepID=UPI001FEDF581|nr:DUF2325 domain-containing protein [Burkholderia perseverans]
MISIARLPWSPDRCSEPAMMPAAPLPPSDEPARLRHALAERDAAAVLLAGRAAAAEERLDVEQARVRMLREQLDDALHALNAAKREAAVLEQAFAATPGGLDFARPSLRAMRGRRIVYVGGRAGSNAALERLVGSAGGSVALHDGANMSDERWERLVAGADLVVFAADRVDREAAARLAAACEVRAVPLRRLKAASAAGVVDAIAAEANAARRASGIGLG